MDCLRDYIGIRGCGSTTPESGLYVNQLAGVSLKSIEQMSNEDQLTFAGVWSDVQARCVALFRTAVQSQLSHNYKLNRLVDTFHAGESYDPTETLAPSGAVRGFQIEINPNDSYPNISPLLSLYLSDLQFYAVVAGTYEFSIYNGDDNTVLNNWTVDCVEGFNTILNEYKQPINTVIQKLVIVLEDVTVTTIKTTLGYGSGSGNGGCCGCCSDCCDALLKGYTNDGTIETQVDNIHGFRVHVSQHCSFDGLICVNKDLFATAWWFMLGKELMMERLFSERINKFTTIDRPKADALLEYYEDQYKTELSSVLKNVSLNDSGCCVECDPKVSQKWTQL